MGSVPPPDAPRSLDGAVPVVLPLAPASARLARQHVQAVTGRQEDARVALIVTELVVNAVVHARSRPQLRVAWEAGAISVEVFDDGPGRPVLTPLSDAPTTSGRGLALVDGMADRWGVREVAGGGKAVWAVVRTEADGG